MTLWLIIRDFVVNHVVCKCLLLNTTAISHVSYLNDGMLGRIKQDAYHIIWNVVCVELNLNWSDAVLMRGWTAYNRANQPHAQLLSTCCFSQRQMHKKCGGLPITLCNHQFMMTSWHRNNFCSSCSSSRKSKSHMWPLLLTWFNFNPSMDK